MVRRQQRPWLVVLLLLAALVNHPVGARRILIWKLLARTNRTILKSDWTGNLLTTTIDALIRAKTQQQQQQQEQQQQGPYESDTTSSATFGRPTRLANHRGGAVLASSHHLATNGHANSNHLVEKLRALLFQSPLVASPWTIGLVVGAVTVAAILQIRRNSYPGVPLEDWELMCRDQLPDFWKTEVLPLLESDTEHCDGRLAKKMIRKTRPLMKQRIQLAEQVSTILGSHLKTRQPLTSQEKATLAAYYAEITVEKLHSVTEGLRQKLEQANHSPESDRPPSSTTRYLGDRSKIIQGIVQRIRTYMDGDAIMLDETTLREYFKESLREAIVVVSTNESNEASTFESASSEHEQDLATDEDIVEAGPTDSAPEDATPPGVNEDSELNPTAITVPSEVVDHEQ